ncbi:MAG TPA: hypothetical protein VNN73_10755 [Blastocatellia bacterium]|nr:hypothetical protein [Blastocatellia bacterium]
MNEADRFNVNHPDLCPHLRWKGMFIQVPHDPSVPPSNDGSFWCLYTQTCIGPDGRLAEPGECTSSDRACYGTGQV